MTAKTISTLLVAVLVISGTSAVLAANDASSTAHETTANYPAAQETTTVQPNETTQANETANVTFKNQTTNGTYVVVQSVTLPEGGFVNVHNTSLFQGRHVQSVVGVSDYLEPGTYQNVTVRLFTGVRGANYTRSRLDTGNHTLVAMAHRDTNNNQTFNYVATNGSADIPYKINGTAVISNATVSVQQDTTANQTAARLPPEQDSQ